MSTVNLPTMECSICFDIDVEVIGCCDEKCENKICLECLKQYLHVSKQSNALLKCVSENCAGFYDEKCFKVSNFTEKVEISHDFSKLLLNHYTLANKTDLDSYKAAKQFVEARREEKLKFLKEKVPKGISHVADVLFKPTVVKIQKKFTEKKPEGKTCFNLTCSGYLTEDMICQLCQSRFCKDCEEKITTEPPPHICSEENKKSISAIRAIVSCPKCGVKIEKGEGCMAMTCAVCNHNFWYNTKEESDVGNHGQSKKVKLNNVISLAKTYDYILPNDLKEEIEKIELKAQPSNANYSLKIFQIISESEPDLEKLSKLYSKMIRENLKLYYANKQLTELEERLKKPKKDWENIRKIIFLYK